MVVVLVVPHGFSALINLAEHALHTRDGSKLHESRDEQAASILKWNELSMWLAGEPT